MLWSCWSAVMMGLGVLVVVQPGVQRVDGGGAMHHATGTFEVKIKPEALSEVASGASLQRLSLDKVFHGGLEGTSKGEMLAAGSAEGSGGYVAMERVTGTLDGKAGSFALQQSGTMTKRVPVMSVTVVPGSGSGELKGLSGTMTVVIEAGKHSYDLAYEIGPE